MTMEILFHAKDNSATEHLHLLPSAPQNPHRSLEPLNIYRFCTSQINTNIIKKLKAATAEGRYQFVSVENSVI